MQDILVSQVNHFFSEPYSSLLNGMLLGVPIGKGLDLYDSIHRTGLLHLVVLSGSNIAILIAFTSILFIRFGKRVQVVLSGLSVYFFITIVGFDAPITRAFIMALFTLVAIVYGRKQQALFSLMVTAAIMLCINVHWFSEISFQLSLAATAGIIIFYDMLVIVFERIRPGAFSFLKKELATTLAAQIFTTPLIFIYFKEISVIAPAANIMIAPLVAPIMVMGIVFLCVSFIPLISTVVSYVVLGMLVYVVGIMTLLAKIPYSFFKL